MNYEKLYDNVSAHYDEVFEAFEELGKYNMDKSFLRGLKNLKAKAQKLIKYIDHYTCPSGRRNIKTTPQIAENEIEDLIEDEDENHISLENGITHKATE